MTRSAAAAWTCSVLAGLILAGCTGAGTTGDPLEVKEASGPIRLLLIQGYYNHSQAGGLIVLPEEDVALPRHCVLLTNNRTVTGNSCAMHEGPPRYPRGLDHPWHIEATFERSDAPDGEIVVREKQIHAYGEPGRLMAHWNGWDDHPDVGFDIE